MDPSHYSSQTPNNRRPSVDHDANTEQILHFVRDFQMVKREPTDLVLRKKAVLPSIGQTVTFSEDFYRRNSLDDSHSGDGASESDPDRDLDIYMSPRRSSPRIVQGNMRYGAQHFINGTLRPVDRPVSRAGRPTHNGTFQKRLRTDTSRSNAIETRNLPPLSSDQLYERPGAPLPDERPRRQRPSSPGLERQRTSMRISSPGVERLRTRVSRPASPRPGTRHGRRELLREYSTLQKDLPQRPSAPSPSDQGALVRDEQFDILKFD